MLGRLLIPVYLEKLRMSFKHLEQIPTNKNFGLPSSGSIGIWLLQFVLIDESDQDKILTEIVEAENIQTVKNLIAKLTTAEALKKILYDYESVNGKFKFNIARQYRNSLLQKAEALGLRDLLLRHLHLSDTTGFAIEMINTINLKWAPAEEYRCNAGKDSVVLESGTMKFKDKDLSAFIADNTVANFLFAQVNYAERAYNVTKFHLAVAGSAAYLIQAVRAHDQQFVAQSYYSIIQEFSKINVSSSKAVPCANITITESITDAQRKEAARDGSTFRSHDKFQTKIIFPRLAGDLHTKDQRLGSFGYFMNKKIANLPIDSITITRDRVLAYDETGARVLNTCRARRNMNYPGHNVITTTISYDNNFMLTYVAASGADYYPFQIELPERDLKQTFRDGEPFPRNLPFTPSPTPTPDNEENALSGVPKHVVTLSDIDIFKKIYRALLAGKTCIFKNDFLKDKENLNADNLKIAVKMSNDPDVKQAWSLTDKFLRKFICKKELFTKIHLYCFENSLPFSNTIVDNKIFFFSRSLRQYLNNQHSGILPVKSHEEAPASRTENIRKALVRC
jgi:hypothetical protein